jgi:transposase
VARGIDDLDESQVRQAAKLLERENERLVRRVLELERTLNTTQGHSVSQMELLADLEHRLAVRNKLLFGKGSEKRGTPKTPAQDKAPQTGHGPREQLELAHVERVYELDKADRACTSCGGALTEMAGQFEESEEIDTLERQFVVVHHKRKKYRCACGGCIETALGPEKLIAGGRNSIDFAVSVAIAKYADHLPAQGQRLGSRRAELDSPDRTALMAPRSRLGQWRVSEVPCNLRQAGRRPSKWMSRWAMAEVH